MTSKKHTLTPREAKIPKLATAPNGKAYKRALEVGSVLVYKNGELRRIEAGGKSSMVKKIGPQIRVKSGSKLILKSAKA